MVENEPQTRVGPPPTPSAVQAASASTPSAAPVGTESRPVARPSGIPAAAPPAQPAPAQPAAEQPAAPITLPAEPAAPAGLFAEVPTELPPLKLGPNGKAHIDDFLRYVIDLKASDLHVKAGSPPTIRISGALFPLEYGVLEPEECQSLADALMGPKQIPVLEEKGEVDFAYSLKGLGRFRINVHRQRGSCAIAARRILPGAPDFKDLSLPPAIEQLAGEHRGLLLITGPTSSGKTTTCGAIIKHINQSRRCHIVTIEDPIEILHNDAASVVTQREVGQDTMDFHAALRAAMRQDPDVIFVGEIRDIETVSAALQAAETGHFVLATLHTTNVAETINRIIDFYPAHQQKQVRVALSGSLVGIVTQRLLPKMGGGRAPAIEVMIMNGRIRDCILEGDKTHEITDIIAESGYYGMQTFDQALIRLYQSKIVTLDDAKAAASSPHDFALALQQQGLLQM